MDRAVVERLARSWPRRASVRSGAFEAGFDGPAPYDPAVPDYPENLLPFRDHPLYRAASPVQQTEVLTWAWLVYNDRVITAEEHVANPALAMVAHGVFPGSTDPAVAQAVHQTLIDEHYHTYIHMLAVDRTRKLRSVGSGDGTHLPPSVTYRLYLEARARAATRWERDLLALVWTLVSEVSINAYLALLSRHDGIQPLHRLVTHLHDRDEAAHGRLMVEVAKSLYVHMSGEQRRAFVAALPMALAAFVAHDFSAWAAVVDQVDLAGGAEMVADCRADPGSATLVRDFSGLRRLAAELEILDQLEVELPTNPAVAELAATTEPA